MYSPSESSNSVQHIPEEREEQEEKKRHLGEVMAGGEENGWIH